MDQQVLGGVRKTKTYLSTPPLLIKLEVGEELYLYLTVSSSSISSVLVREKDRVQRPIYYISRVLQNVEIRYTRLKKLIFALVTLAKKLHPYFQAHTMVLSSCISRSDPT